ncbi:MAG: STAS domain-containing protein [Steroidobacteraceae bacterium]
MKDARPEHVATLALQGGERAAINGALDFASVGPLLTVGTEAIEAGHAAFIDLAGVTKSDSAGLALLLEWMSVARAAKRALRYENVPQQLQQLARLSEVEELLLWG